MKELHPYIAQRTCTEVETGKSPAKSELGSQPLEKHSDEGAYVLLAPPGSGKTSEFQRQADLCGGLFVTARDFITFEDKREWHGRTLFIDGLDEVRAGSGDGRTPLDCIRNKLRQLGNPEFRLSCREADWFGANDRRHLEKTIAPQGKILVLRLDPLAKEEINTVLHKNHNVEDPDAFVDAAQQRGVAALLENPLSLKLLAIAVMNNEWPDSRIHTFEMACNTLADESNEEHQVAKVRERANTEVLLDTAGQLCAVQLLAGAQGIHSGPGSQDDSYIELNKIAGASRDLQLDSLKTRLFEAPNSEFSIPLHRQVAEFLGARHLAGLIENGLPVNRILALMSGHDGMIVTEFRSFGAWLAALNEPVRKEMIERDPLGTVLYGDIAGFPKKSKLRILENLKRIGEKNPWFIGTINFDSRLGDLVTSDLKDEILAFLDDPSPGTDQQSFLQFLVESLKHAEPLDGLAPKLIGIIRDESKWALIRRTAIKSFLQQRGDKNAALAELKELMKDIVNGKVSDPDDELLGRLLVETYPTVLPGTEVLDYLREQQTNQAYSYQRFWMWDIFDQINCDKIAELLDQLAVQYRPKQTGKRQIGRRATIPVTVPLILLDGFLSNCSEIAVEPQRLFQWLGVAGRVGDWNQDHGYLHGQRDRIGSWLGERPELWKTLFEFGLENNSAACLHSDQSDFQKLMWMEEDRRLFGARRPLDFANWCLDKAVSLDHSEAADWLIRRVADAVDGESISRTLVDARLEGKEALEDALEQRLSERKKLKSWERKLKRRERKEEKREEKELSQWQIAVRDHRTQLIEKNAPINLLYSLATAYFGGYHGMSEYKPHERLSILLGSNKELVEIALIGLRRVVTRQDLPSINDIVKLGAESKMQYLWYPFLAGFNELSRPDQDYDFIPAENQTELALALFFNVDFWPNPWGAGDDELQPIWLRPLLNDKPKLAAKILIDSITARLRNRKDVSHKLYEFSYKGEYQEIARLASLSILDAMPARCTKQQLSGLHYLFAAAHRYCQRDSFVELINKKLAFRSMSVFARVYWLVAGFLASPADYLELLQRYVNGNKRRAAYLADCIGGRFESGPGQSEIIAAPILSSLIQLLGSEYPPRSFTSDSDSNNERDGRITRAMDVSFRIRNFINQLMRDPSQRASKELENLVTENSLVAWCTQIQYAVQKQKHIRREAVFEHADVSTILGVLKNLQPANPADLAALVLDCIKEIAKNVRDGNTSDWRQYWNVYSDNCAVNPKPENACRDALLSDLKLRLDPLNIDAQPEGHFADDKRADIRVSYGEFNVPVEIKRRHHPSLWTAIKTQLIAKYTRDPGADGNGIYLVFWFGNQETKPPTPDANPPPKSAAELKRRLEESLTDAERRKISVCVIDVEDRKNPKEPESDSHSKTLHPKFGREHVSVLARKPLHAGYLRIDELILRHSLFAGGDSEPFRRELIVRPRGVGILLYDPDRREAVLVRQFRVGMIDEARSPWMLELVAGMVDEGESPLQVAKRESREESGIEPVNVVPICDYYNSPGVGNERISLFCGRVDASAAGGIHGLDSENEDIEVVVVPFKNLVEAVASGLINNAMTIIAVQWLQLHHDELPHLLNTAGAD